MTIYYLDNSSGSATSPYDTKAKAATLLSQITTIMSAGDEIRVSSAHNEVVNATTIHTFPGTKAAPCYMLCIDYSTDAISTGAIISTGNGGYNLSIRGSLYCYGVAFKNGIGSSSSSSIILGESPTSTQIYQNCEFHNVTTGSVSRIQASGSTGGDISLFNCGVSFAAASQGLNLPRCNLVIDGMSLLSGSTSPTALIVSMSDITTASIKNIDLTNAGAGINLSAAGNFTGLLEIANVKCPAAWSGVVSSADPVFGAIIRAINVGAGDTNNLHYVHYNEGVISTDTGIYQNDSDGSERNGALVKSSAKMVSNANTKKWINYLCGELMCYYNTVTTSQTATVEIIHNESAALNDDEIWLELTYPGTGGSTLSTTVNDKAADYYATPAAQATSTAGWDNGLTARADSTAYSLGNIIKVASNSGCAFICTSPGTSAGTEPAGYATAVDGDSITDNTATFKAMRRQKVSVAFTAAEQGPIYARVCVGKASATVWHSTKLTVA